MNTHLHHYGSGFLPRLSALGAVFTGVLAYVVIPDEPLVAVGAIVKNLWVVLGPLGAFAIQISLQLLALGESKFLDDSQVTKLSGLVNQRLRYIWDFTAITLLALVLSMSLPSLNPSIQTDRLAISIGLALLVFDFLLALRFPSLFREIKDFRWRISNEHRAADERASALKAITDERMQPPPEIPEPQLRNGTS